MNTTPSISTSMSIPMSTSTGTFRPEARGSGAATPRVPGFFASRFAPEGIDAVLSALASGQLDYPLADRCPPADQAGPDMVFLTFLWQDSEGPQPAQAVILSANALVDHEDLDAAEFEPVRPGLWAITLKVPSDWVASYRITAHHGPQPAPWREASERRAIRLAADAGGPDPLNPRSTASMNGGALSVACGPDAQLDPHLAQASPDLQRTGPAIGGWGADGADDAVEHERLSRHVFWDENCARERTLWMYRPPEAALATGQPTPLVIVHDGATWVKYLSFATSLDAAITAKALAPVHVMFLDSTSVPLRSQELPVAAGTTLSLARQFLPWAREYFNLSHAPEDTLVTGSSFGGLAALLALTEHPQLIGRAIAQSPSLWHTDLADALRALDPKASILMQAGCYETAIFDSCERTLDSLAGCSAAGQIDFQLVSGGHDWAWWAPRLLTALGEAYPGSRPVKPDACAPRPQP